MAARDPGKQQVSLGRFSFFLFLSLLCFASLLVFSAFRSAIGFSTLTYRRADFEPETGEKRNQGFCNYSEGVWIRQSMSVPRYDESCREIFKGWNCIASNKQNALDILKWRWQPKSCDLNPFDPVKFLERLRGKNIGFVGDSLNRNMFVSLVCTLKEACKEVKKWRPAGADRGFIFLRYNLTIAYHRTNLLAHYGRWTANSNGGALESLGYKEGFRVDVDVPEGTWANAPHFHDILILNTGHWWWAPSKFDPVQSPMLFFENGLPIVPPLPPELGLDRVLKHMLSFVDERMKPTGLKIFRTQSPRHFEGGDWDQGGSCHRQRPLSQEQVLLSTCAHGSFHFPHKSRITDLYPPFPRLYLVCNYFSLET